MISFFFFFFYLKMTNKTQILVITPCAPTFWLVERSVAHRMDILTRAHYGHAPKLLLITSILLPLTEHYRVLESYLLRSSPILANRKFPIHEKRYFLIFSFCLYVISRITFYQI